MPAVNYAKADDVAILEIANPPVNALSLAVREGLMEGLARASADAGVVAVVICGADGIFPAGADINEIASGLALRAPMILDVQARMEAAGKPLVAALEGNALGGGFELALTCHWRVATPAATVGLPEVKLGLIPGAGGTQRFTRLAGPQAALEAITSGAQLPAARALDLGLIDRIADDAVVAAAALGRQAARERWPLRITSELDERIRGVNGGLFTAFRQKIAVRARGQLAPWKIIDSIEVACTRPKAEAFRFERDCFIECRDSPQRRALTHLFFAEREARRIPGVGPDVKPLPIARAGVIGAGTMGGGIAMCFANAGIPVRVLELSADALERGLAVIAKNYAASVARGSLTQQRAERALALIQGVTGYGELDAEDIVIEAVFEDMDVKKEVFVQLDRVAAPRAILATNTSTLDIDAIAAATSRPAESGRHPLLQPGQRDAAARERARRRQLSGDARHRHGARQDTRQGAGAGRQLRRIHRQPHADVLRLGGRIPARGGSDSRADRSRDGRLRICHGTARGARSRRQRRRLPDPQGAQAPPDERFSPILERLVERGRLGQKAGKGFYRYEGRTRISDPEVLALVEGVSRDLKIRRRQIPDEEILDRLLHPLVNEGARILDEGIALRAGDIDVVYVNGYGFPAWRGGPMYWAAQAGLRRVVDTMHRLAPSHGARWRPAPLLEQLAATGHGWPSVREPKSR